MEHSAIRFSCIIPFNPSHSPMVCVVGGGEGVTIFSLIYQWVSKKKIVCPWAQGQAVPEGGVEPSSV